MIARRRLDAQRVTGARFDSPEEVVSWLGAVQAQDYLGALWAVGLRMKHARESDVERALADGRIVRTWPMRGTLHFVAAADARWMTQLLAPHIVSGAAKRIRELELDAKTFTRAAKVLEKELAGRRVIRPEVYRLLERAKISTRGQRGIHLLWKLAQDCLICFGPREGKQQTFVLFDEWLPTARPRPRDEALGELALRYFESHGPATAGDFTWWARLRAADAREALALASGALQVETFDGATFYSVPGRAPTKSRDAHVLPAFDEFLVAYTDRSAALDVAHKLRVNDGGGILKPTFVVDERVHGTWQRTLSRQHVTVKLNAFSPLSPPRQRALARAFERYADFLGLRFRPRP